MTLVHYGQLAWHRHLYNLNNPLKFVQRPDDLAGGGYTGRERFKRDSSKLGRNPLTSSHEYANDRTMIVLQRSDSDMTVVCTVIEIK